jgi:hypothetical protein
MEQRVFIKDLREEGHGSTQIHSKLVGHYWDKPLSYPDVGDCVRQLRIGQESIKDSRRSRKLLDFQAHFRIEGALEASPNGSTRDLAQTISIAPSTIFYVLTEVLHLEFRTSRWVPTNSATIRNE